MWLFPERTQRAGGRWHGMTGFHGSSASLGRSFPAGLRISGSHGDRGGGGHAEEDQGVALQPALTENGLGKASERGGEEVVIGVADEQVGRRAVGAAEPREEHLLEGVRALIRVAFEPVVPHGLDGLIGVVVLGSAAGDGDEVAPGEVEPESFVELAEEHHGPGVGGEKAVESGGKKAVAVALVLGRGDRAVTDQDQDGHGPDPRAWSLRQAA